MALLFFFVLLLTSATNSVAATNDFTAFVHKTCSNNQTLRNQTLDTLFTSLVSQSSTTNFFKTTITNITGLYQCRDDVSLSKCKTCVQKLTNTIETSCYSARAQLVGCYMWYEVDVYHVDYPPNGLWYEKCGVRDGTRTGTESIPYTGQCEGDLSVGQCVECTKTAVEFAQADCGSPFTGDIYLQKCYIYYSDGGDYDGGNASGLVALMVASVVFVLLLAPTIIFY